MPARGLTWARTGSATGQAAECPCSSSAPLSWTATQSPLPSPTRGLPARSVAEGVMPGGSAIAEAGTLSTALEAGLS